MLLACGDNDGASAFATFHTKKGRTMFSFSSLGRFGVFVIVLILSMFCASELSADDSANDDACLFCHSKITPGLVKQWRKSTHSTSGVGCLACHGAEQSDPDSWIHGEQWISSIVTPKDCAECHEKEYVEFAASHHSTAGLILHSKDNMLGEFIAGGPNAVLGCKQCHGSQLGFTKTFADGSTFTLDMAKISGEVMDTIMASHNTDMKGLLRYKTELSEGIAAKIEAQWAPHKNKPLKPETPLAIDHNAWPNSGIGRFNPDGSMGSCNACHSRHDFSRALARQPESCGKCHMGPDHPHIEIYNESKHGIAYRNQMADMNLDSVKWVVGEDYFAAPTCATCHMSATPDMPVSHDVGLRISWTLRPPISTLTTSHTATLNDEDEIVESDVPWQHKRAAMMNVCRTCHTVTHVQNFYKQYDALVNLYNEKFAKPGVKLMKYVREHGYLNKVGFTNELDWIWFELWHHEGRRMRHGAAMMGPDFTHWHGSYEVSKNFYMKFLPKIEALAEKHNDATLKKLIQDEVFSKPEHAWYDGMDKEEAARIRAMYSNYHERHLTE